MALMDDPYGPSDASDSTPNEAEVPLLSSAVDPPSYEDVEFPLEPSADIDAKRPLIQHRDSGDGAEAYRPYRELTRWERNEYRPSYSLDREGNISSTDPRLSADPSTLHRFLLRHSEATPQLQFTVNERMYPSQTEVGPFVGYWYAVPASTAVDVGLGKGAAPLLYADGPWALTLRGETEGSTNVFDEDGHEDELQGQRDLEGGARSPVSLSCICEAAEGNHRGGRIVLLADRWNMLQEEQKRRARLGWPRFINPKSMVNLLAPTSGHPVVQHRAHPPRLFQNRFLDLDDVHSVDSEAHRKHDDAVYRVVEDYCRDRNPARSLRVDFETYGWDFNRLEEAIRDIVKETGSGTGCRATSTLSPQSITVRPANLISQVLQSSGVPCFFLCVTLIFPLVWLIDHYFGAQYNQIRVARPLTRWRLLPPPDSSTSHTVRSATELARTLAACPPFVQQLPSGEWVYLVGQTEDEWLKDWEVAIGNAVKEKTGQSGPAERARRIANGERVDQELGREPVMLTEQDRLREPVVARSLLAEVSEGCTVM